MSTPTSTAKTRASGAIRRKRAASDSVAKTHAAARLPAARSNRASRPASTLYIHLLLRGWNWAYWRHLSESTSTKSITSGVRQVLGT